jgi:hypothetical protein
MGDKEKLATYCKLVALDQRLEKESDAKCGGNIDAFIHEAEELQRTQDPEYVKMAEGLEVFEPQSKEQELVSLADLDKLCAGKTTAPPSGSSGCGH